jgi:hypothetical protein
MPGKAFILGPKVNEISILCMEKVIDRTVQALDISRLFLNKILKEEPVELNDKSGNKCKDFQSLYFDTFKECFFSKVTHNFLIETYSFFKKMPTTNLLIKSLSKLSKESLHLLPCKLDKHCFQHFLASNYVI